MARMYQAENKFAKAAKACKGKKKTAFRACMRKKLRGRK